MKDFIKGYAGQPFLKKGNVMLGKVDKSRNRDQIKGGCSRRGGHGYGPEKSRKTKESKVESETGGFLQTAWSPEITGRMRSTSDDPMTDMKNVETSADNDNLLFLRFRKNPVQFS